MTGLPTKVAFFFFVCVCVCWVVVVVVTAALVAIVTTVTVGRRGFLLPSVACAGGKEISGSSSDSL